MVIASIAVQNMGSVEISYYDFKLQLHSLELPLMVVVVTPLILGFLIAWVLGLLERLKMKTQLRQQNKQISSMEEELDSLKNTPQLPIQAESSTDSWNYPPLN